MESQLSVDRGFTAEMNSVGVDEQAGQHEARATAPMEMRLLTVLLRNVKSVITATDSSGRNRISHGKSSFFIRQSFIEVKSSTCADWRLR